MNGDTLKAPVSSGLAAASADGMSGMAQVMQGSREEAERGDESMTAVAKRVPSA